MKKQNVRGICVAVSLLLIFVLWTLMIRYVDCQSIGPNGSTVGFATLNGMFHSMTGVHMSIYIITDWLGLVALVFICGFGLIGFIQLLKRRSLLKVDADILVLGMFYIIVLFSYLLFEKVVINYRPILIEGFLEASYPSSTTLLIMCVIPTAIMQLKKRLTNSLLRTIIKWLLVGFTVFMVLGRLVSGVHWLTDIIGGVILSGGLVLLYYYTVNLLLEKEEKKR